MHETTSYTQNNTRIQKKALFALIVPQAIFFILPNYYKQTYTKHIAYTMRQNVYRNNFHIKILEDKRASSKRNNITIWKTRIPYGAPYKSLRDNSTQTEPESNKGNG